jgi:CRP-like cAMP-binding protein
VEIDIRLSVYEPGGPIPHVYFPISAVFSLVAVTDGRVVVEVATIGREGMVGLPAFLGAANSPHAAFCQIGGSAAELNVDDLRKVVSANGDLRRLLDRFTQSTIVQIAQNVVCNNTHDVEQRAARWLLTTHDRVGHDGFPLTQEFLAQMLGVRRTTVSHVANRLQSAGLIRYRRGNLAITDRRRLEQAACECYGIVKREFDEIS